MMDARAKILKQSHTEGDLRKPEVSFASLMSLTPPLRSRLSTAN